MKKCVWKYALMNDHALYADRVEINVPRGAEWLALQMQSGVPTVWARVDPDARTERRTIYIEMTGQAVRDPAAEYLGTFQLLDGTIVLHAFISPAADGGRDG